MNAHAISLPDHYQAVIDRFVAACQADERIIAAFLSGSYAQGTADVYSDLDLGLITSDAAYEVMLAERAAFIRLLGEPVFLENFNFLASIFFIFPDGVEGELAVGCASQLQHLHGGPHHALLDKTGVLANAVFPWDEVDHTEQVETLRRLVYSFWHDLSHFITAIGRGQLWWAYGQLEELRRMCINLARLRQNFSASADGYEKVERAIPAEHLSPLETTYCPLERSAMLQSAHIIVRFYRELARPLAQTHGIAYPADLDRIMSGRLEQLP